MPSRPVYAAATLAIALATSPRAQQADIAATLRAQIDRIYTENAYAAPRFGPARWLPDGVAYAIVERSEQGAEIARYDAATGARSVLATTKLDVDDYSWSSDGKRLLVFTNTKKVWRQNTRGDYYVIDVAGAPGVEKKLGGTRAGVVADVRQVLSRCHARRLRATKQYLRRADREWCDHAAHQRRHNASERCALGARRRGHRCER